MSTTDCSIGDGNYEQQVLIGTDSDYAPLIQIMKERHPGITQGVIAPLLPIEKNGVEVANQAPPPGRTRCVMDVKTDAASVWGGQK